MTCAIEKGIVSASDFTSVEFRDDGRYETTCLKSHKSLIILQQQKFELVFDIGAYAIADGYYREAVSSFTSSLERFYEFFVKAVLFEKGIADAVISDSWKAITKQSERQLGAFVFLYTSELQQTPVLLKEKEVQFRNNVVHRGTIPSQQDALEYGQVILDLIRPVLQEVKQRYPNGLQQTVFEHLKRSRQHSSEQSGTICIPTIISLSSGEEAWHKRSLEQAIKELRRWR
jgi:hypothetical protein